MSVLTTAETDLVRGVGLFQGLDPEALGAVVEQGRQRSVRRGASCFFEKEPAQCFYLLVEDRVKLLQTVRIWPR